MSSRASVWRAIITFVVVAGAFGLAVSSSVTLGLDLKGGTQIILQTQDTKRVKADADATDRALQVLRGRVDALGVAEPTLARSGEDRIIVERSEEHTSELQSRFDLVCRLLLEKKK